MQTGAPASSRSAPADSEQARGRAPRVVVPAPEVPGAARRGAVRPNPGANTGSSGAPNPGSNPGSSAGAGSAAPRPNSRVASSDWDLPTSSRAPQHAPASALDQIRENAATDREYERGLPGWAALIVLLAIAGVGGLYDMVNGTHVRGGFNVGIIAASIVAILVVRRSAMFPVVVAPPIVYSVASGSLLYLRSHGLHDRKVLIDTAANWLVYGFPAIAAATAAVLIIAGIRMVIRK